jgi:hypothetical protein
VEEREVKGLEWPSSTETILVVDEGALGVVEKPFQIQDFATAVRTAIDRP